MAFFGVVLGDGRQREEKKKGKTQLIIFCKPHKTPSGSKKKMVSVNVCREPGGNFVNLGWWNRSGHSGPFTFKTRGIVNELVRGMGVFRSRSRRWPAAGRKEKRKKHSLSFSPDPTKHPARVRQKRKTGWKGVTALGFWRLSLGNLYHLVKAMFARESSRRAGSEAQGEGRESV